MSESYFHIWVQSSGIYVKDVSKNKIIWMNSNPNFLYFHLIVVKSVVCGEGIKMFVMWFEQNSLRNVFNPMRTLLRKPVGQQNWHMNGAKQGLFEKFQFASVHPDYDVNKKNINKHQNKVVHLEKY